MKFYSRSLIYVTLAMGFFLVLPVHAGVDTDNDGVADDVEATLGTSPLKADSDADGFPDGVELKNGFNPLKGGGDRGVKRRVEVNISTQHLDYFVNDVKIGTVLVSTGKPGTPTPKGTYRIIRKRPVVNYKNYPNTKWNAEFKKSFYIHGAYWHNLFGIRPVSGGCVNVAYKDMESLYRFLSADDEVKIFGTIPPAPLKLTEK